MVRAMWVAFGVLAASVAVASSPAFAADTVYWGNYAGTTISHANLSGGGGGDFTMTGATVNDPYGIAIDAAAGKIYWANFNGNAISVANLDGTGAHDLTISGVTVSDPEGIAIYPAAGKIYWGNDGDDTIDVAKLDGSGAAALTTSGATVNSPDGVAIDPASNKIYWANASDPTHPVAFANLDGTGSGGDLNVTGTTSSNAIGVAISPTNGRIYWANQVGKINFANLDDSGGGGVLNAGGATMADTQALAIDPTGGKVYWANGGSGGISYANLDNTGGGVNLDTTGATTNFPTYPALLRAPSPEAAPFVSGTRITGSALSCSTGTWGADFLGSFLYRAPQTFSYAWTLNGAPIAGAVSSTLTTRVAGSYACTVSAANHAGSASQSSVSVSVVGALPGAATGKASPVGSATAVLNGTVNPGQETTGYYFQYGRSAAYSARIPAGYGDAGSDANNHGVSQRIAGLRPGRTYHFRVVATNTAGTAYGADRTFKAAPLIAALRVTPNAFKPASSGQSIGRNKGTKVRYRLGERAKVTFTVQLVLKAKHGTRRVKLKGSFKRTSKAGAVSFGFTGRLNHKALAPGNYVLTAVARGAGGIRLKVSVRFTIRT